MTLQTTESDKPMTDLEKTTEKWEVQLRKGTLELVVLAALQHGSLYGLELLRALQRFPSAAITEGTLYPLLDRLKREGLLEAEWVQQDDSRPRKYYRLSPAGQQRLIELTRVWRQSAADIEQLLTQRLLASTGPSQLTAQSADAAAMPAASTQADLTGAVLAQPASAEAAAASATSSTHDSQGEHHASA